MLLHKVMASPVGRLKLVAGDGGLKAVLWEHDDPRRVPLEASRASASHPLLVETEAQLGQYFAGERRHFQLPLDFAGTPFQQAVWRALLDIGYGATRSYEELARRIGKPTACRAVGAANGRNPLSIVVPCHRVLGKRGALTGFAGGLEAKSYLLDLERRWAGPSGLRILRECRS
ncbi:methylated-DNA--protein-cysteinemethyltransferase [Sphingobium cloacae]|uniref:Methylated-DNA--protein-cysteine methyltransferase n=2 Tax=Sphingobium cloacae TaxID=120107 RepID=A0A1E1EZW7_9SPHN|nr:methylated-DNA--[protein]-cysteine S-methyltransferase [Sphingobium cloacae]BAV63803.1 methylated-DNA--protein-cysteinemethyltransferase [Sphingobium cloacae]